MKFFATILVIFALISSSLALKDPVCGEEHSADGDGLFKCVAYVPSWTYDASQNECISYIYGGCGGNNNRFGSKALCEEKCKE